MIGLSSLPSVLMIAWFRSLNPPWTRLLPVKVADALGASVRDS